VYGIVSETKLIRLDPVLFKENGKGWITIEGNDLPLSDEPLRYVVDKNDPLLQNIVLELTNDPLQKKRTFVRVVSITGILGGFCLTGIKGYSWYRSDQSLENLSDEESFSNLNRDGGSILWRDTEQRRNNNIIFTGCGAALTAVGIAGVWWSFTF
jgi:hypothetical protein